MNTKYGMVNGAIILVFRIIFNSQGNAKIFELFIFTFGPSFLHLA